MLKVREEPLDVVHRERSVLEAVNVVAMWAAANLHRDDLIIPYFYVKLWQTASMWLDEELEVILPRITDDVKSGRKLCLKRIDHGLCPFLAGHGVDVISRANLVYRRLTAGRRSSRPAAPPVRLTL